ncbi:MAG: flavodoxin family protein [Oscillospiraceae bacterium]|jgi:multimeric flavodoxin WrbA|nr:flavodoxin family protein [Oscillospiraceae bacterium]
MKFLIVSGNPKNDGLTAAIIDEVARGARDGGAEVEILRVEKLERCHVCNGGWGECRATHKCVFGGDGFDEAQAKIKAADALALITPIYWAEISESLKGFIDRLRRCEFSFDGTGALSGKQTLIAVNAGGSGNGIITAVEQLDRFCQHTGAVIFDRLGFNRWNHDYKRPAAYAAARAIAEGRKNGESL